MTAPLTPLGARTPHAHPALPWVIGVLALVIAAGVILVFMRDESRNVGTPALSVTPSPVTALAYRNEQYGFSVALPSTWQGFTKTTTQGDAWAIESMNVTDHFPLISIRHPLWTAAIPRQDIPIMVFSTQQWRDIQAERLSVGAAPIPPSFLASNSAHVFALPARYNYAFPKGWEEVEQILKTSPVSAFELTP